MSNNKKRTILGTKVPSFYHAFFGIKNFRTKVRGIKPKIFNKNVLANIVKNLEKVKEVQAVYLFGSYAMKKIKPYSDIDICVITQNDLPLEKKAALVSNFLSDKIDMSIFFDLPLAVRFRVLKEGKLLYCKNKLFLHRTKVDTVKRYIDFRPIVDRHINKVLGV